MNFHASGSFTNAQEGEVGTGELWIQRKLCDNKKIKRSPDMSGKHVQCDRCYQNL